MSEANDTQSLRAADDLSFKRNGGEVGAEPLPAWSTEFLAACPLRAEVHGQSRDPKVGKAKVKARKQELAANHARSDMVG